MIRLDEPASSPELILDSPFREGDGDISPNGRWLAYQADESGQDEIYLREFPNVDSPRVRISTAGGEKPMWARDGSELFFWSGTELHVVPIDPESDRRTGPPSLVLDVGVRFITTTGGGGRRRSDISLDGERFLLVGAAGSEEPPNTSENSIIVVQNWFEELTERVPVN